MLEKTKVKVLDKVVVRFPETPVTECSWQGIFFECFGRDWK